MTTFIFAFGFFMITVAAMGVGYLVQRKAIAGSCGGLSAVGIDKACDCPDPCDRRKAREAREAKRAEKISAWQDNKIL